MSRKPKEKPAAEPAEQEFDSAAELVGTLASNAASLLEASELGDFEPTNLFTEEMPDLLPSTESVEGTELEAFESAEIEDIEFVEDERIDSIIESLLFASDRPVSLAAIKAVFKGTNVKTDKIRRHLEKFAVELAGSQRGVTLEEVNGGYQLRTKIDNVNFLKRSLKNRPFKLSGPALEVLSIIAYKQPLIKSEVDEIRGVESGHLLRALMEKNLVSFEGKSELPGKPMQYGTTRKFLEIFGLRNLKELPTLSQIDELLPEGIDEEGEADRLKLSDLTGNLSQSVGQSYSEGEEELMKITDQLQTIGTTSDFFEQEKKRQAQKRDADRAQNIRDAIMMGEEVSTRDRNWLTRFDEALMEGTEAQFSQDEEKAIVEEAQAEELSEMEELAEELGLEERLFDEAEDGESSGEVQV